MTCSQAESKDAAGQQLTIYKMQETGFRQHYSGEALDVEAGGEVVGSPLEAAQDVPAVLATVDLDVLVQVVGACKPLATHLTLVGLDPAVTPAVPGQLVAPAELPPTAGPGAGEGFLPRVPPHVRLQVRRLGVQLLAAWRLAHEHLVLLLDVGLGGGVPSGDAGAVGQVVTVCGAGALGGGGGEGGGA